MSSVENTGGPKPIVPLKTGEVTEATDSNKGPVRNRPVVEVTGDGAKSIAGQTIVNIGEPEAAIIHALNNPKEAGTGASRLLQDSPGLIVFSIQRNPEILRAEKVVEILEKAISGEDQNNNISNADEVLAALSKSPLSSLKRLGPKTIAILKRLDEVSKATEPDAIEEATKIVTKPEIAEESTEEVAVTEVEPKSSEEATASEAEPKATEETIWAIPPRTFPTKWDIHSSIKKDESALKSTSPTAIDAETPQNDDLTDDANPKKEIENTENAKSIYYENRNTKSTYDLSKLMKQYGLSEKDEAK